MSSGAVQSLHQNSLRGRGTDANVGMGIKPEREREKRKCTKVLDVQIQELKLEQKENGKRWSEGRRGSPAYIFNSPQPLPIYQGK